MVAKIRWLLRLDVFSSIQNKRRNRNKTSLPKSLIVKVLPQLEALTNENIDDHLFYQPVKNFPESFSAEEKTALTESYNNVITKKVIPAYRNLHNFMSNEYLAAGRTSSGIDAIPNGDKFYNHQIKTYTTTNMTADEIHQLGLSEVARILSEMEKVKKEVGFEGDIKSFFDHVRNSKELMP